MAVNEQPITKKQQQQHQQLREALARSRAVVPKTNPHEALRQQRQSEAKRNLAILEELLRKMRYESDRELILGFVDEMAVSTSRICKALAQAKVNQDRLRDHQNNVVAQLQQYKAAYESLLEQCRMQQQQEASSRRGGPAVRGGGKEIDDDSISSASSMSN